MEKGFKREGEAIKREGDLKGWEECEIYGATLKRGVHWEERGNLKLRGDFGGRGKLDREGGT